MPYSKSFAREKVRGSKFLENVPLRLQKRKKRIYFTSELYVLGIVPCNTDKIMSVDSYVSLLLLMYYIGGLLENDKKS